MSRKATRFLCFLLILCFCAFTSPCRANDEALDDRIRLLVAQLGPGKNRGTCNPWTWGSGSVADRAAAELAIIGEPAFDQVLPLLSDPVEWRRIFAIDILQRLRDPRAVEPMIAVLRTDMDPGVRAHVTYAFRELKDPRTADALLDALGDQSDWVRAGAADALGALRERRAIDRLIILLGEGPIVQGGPIHFPTPMGKAIEACKEIGRPAVPALLEALQSKNQYARTNAASALGEIKAKEAVPRLIEMLNEPYWPVGEKVAEALGNIGDERAFEPLAAAARSKELSLAGEAAQALGKLGDRRATAILISMLDGKEEGLRSDAAKALGGLRDRKAIEVLARHLFDGEWGTPWWCAESLGKIDDPRSVNALIRAASSGGDELRCEAMKALARLKNPSLLSFFIRKLHDSDINVREYAAEGLGRLDLNLLITLLQARESNTRSAAASALRTLREKGAIPALVEALRFDESRSEVIGALGEAGDPSIVPKLMPYLKEKDTYVSLAAITAIDTLQTIERTTKFKSAK